MLGLLGEGGVERIGLFFQNQAQRIRRINLLLPLYKFMPYLRKVMRELVFARVVDDTRGEVVVLRLRASHLLQEAIPVLVTAQRTAEILFRLLTAAVDSASSANAPRHPAPRRRLLRVYGTLVIGLEALEVVVRGDVEAAVALLGGRLRERGRYLCLSRHAPFSFFLIVFGGGGDLGGSSGTGGYGWGRFGARCLVVELCQSVLVFSAVGVPLAAAAGLQDFSTDISDHGTIAQVTLVVPEQLIRVVQQPTLLQLLDVLPVDLLLARRRGTQTDSSLDALVGPFVIQAANLLFSEAFVYRIQQLLVCRRNPCCIAIVLLF